jgi:hypothetical protein
MAGSGYSRNRLGCEGLTSEHRVPKPPLGSHVGFEAS